MNLCDYIFLRRVNRAFIACADNDRLNPNRIFCAIQITSPRTKKISENLEKQIYNTAIVLRDGTNRGFRTGITLTEFIMIAHIYNYMNDYEIQADMPLRQTDIIRAI